VPNSFRQVTSERLKRIVDVEKSCPQIFKIALKFRLLMLLEVIQVALKNVDRCLATRLIHIEQAFSDQLPVL
jgi:hypothetical protein